MRFVIEVIVKMWCHATYRDTSVFHHDPRVINYGTNALKNRQQPLG